MEKNQQTDEMERFFGSLKRAKREQVDEFFKTTFTPLPHCYGRLCRDRKCDHRKRSPALRSIAATDTENWQKDGPGHKKGDFRCGTVFDGTTYHRFKDPDSMGNHLLSRTYAGFYIWAHNLAYDLQNIWGHRLPQHGSIIGSQLYFADYPLRRSHTRDHRAYIHFRDSTRHYPAKLSTLADKMGMRKMYAEIDDLDSLSESEIQDRCDSDTLIVFTFIQKLQETYNEFGTSLRATVGSSSLELFRRRYMRHNARQLDHSRLELLLNSYYGGRCEAFFIGNLPTGHYSMGDVNSMYPTVMQDLCLPIPSREVCWHSGESVDFRSIDRIGATECTVQVSESMYPPLPYRCPESGRLLFPWGKFRAWWPNNELQYAVNHGVRIHRIHQQIWFSASCVPFKDFVQDLYGLKLEGGWKALVAKHLLNNNYGKWCQSRPPKKLIPYLDYLEKRVKERSSSEVVTELKDKQGNPISVLIQPEGYDFPIHSNIIWGAYITAAARILLHSLLINHSGYYCDTDSVLTADSLPVTDTLGILALQTSCRGAYLAGPKAYALLGHGEVLKLKVKGVPNRPGWFQDEEGVIHDTANLQAMALLGYRVYFDSPLKLIEGFSKVSTEQMRKSPEGTYYLEDSTDEIRPNLWYTHNRKLKLTCEKRILDGKSGWTRPIKVG